MTESLTPEPVSKRLSPAPDLTNRRPLTRRAALAGMVGGLAIASGCAGIDPASYSAEKPVLDLKTYFSQRLPKVEKALDESLAGTSPICTVI